MQKKMWVLLFIIVSIGFFSGCTNTYRLQHDGLTDLINNKKTGDTTLYAADVDSYFSFVTEKNGNDYVLLDFHKVENYYAPADIASHNTNHPEEPPIGNAKEKTTYKISNDSLKDYQYTLDHGATHGLLVVPFKYRTHDGALTGGSTVGYYVGYQKLLFGTATTVLASIGLSPVATQDVNTKEIDNKWGLTGAVGIVGAFTKGFQLGFVAGYDHLGGNSGKDWPYENNLWWSIAIGFNFMQ